MKCFSINQLEKLSGIKAHTIRIWELRYSVFSPQRSDGNARRYSIDELGKLLHISLLNKNGFKISNLCKMQEAELEAAVAGVNHHEARKQRSINNLILCMYSLDTEGFETELNDCYLSWPVETVVDEIIFPFLKKVGLLCQGKQLNEEHLVVTAIRKKLLWSIERIGQDKGNGKSILLFLSGERQLDLLLLCLYFHLKKAGWDVLYMGVDISIKNIEELLSIKQPDCLITYLPKKHCLSIDDLSRKLASQTPESLLYVIDEHGTRPFVDNENIRAMTIPQAMEFSASY